MTRNRQRILEIIRQAPQHRTAEEIFLLAKEGRPHMARATVYNNLAALVSEGLVRRLHLGTQADVYDRATEPHAHILCEGCGAVTDAPLPGFAKEISERLGTEAHFYDLIVYTLCRGCRG